MRVLGPLLVISTSNALVPWCAPRLPSTSPRIDVAQAARRVKRGGALQATPVGAGGGSGRALLALTIALEVFATTSMKLASTRPIWHLGTVVGYGSCFSVFPLVLRKMPLGVAYAIWSGVGTALTALIGAALFGEALSTQKVGALAVIVAGVVLLELAH